MGELPSTRIRPARAFENISVDHFGPMGLKGEREKRFYVLVVVCHTTKMVALEWSTDLAIPKVKALIERHVIKKGVPKTIISDGAPTFVAISKQVNVMGAVGEGKKETVWKVVAADSLI
jgi:hypothetical protein